MNMNDEIRMTNDERNFVDGVLLSGASWTAVAERSGDTAFARTKHFRVENNPRAVESGVALRFPPQSKTRQAGESLGKKICRETACSFFCT
jgi:hypothetical protein